jgi:hypothetical protein
MKIAIYQSLHVVSMVFLTALVFQALANPDPARKRPMMAWIGSLAFAMLVGGFGMVAVMKVGFPWWVMVKVGCWLGLVVIASLAYRMPQKIALLRAVAVVLVAAAVATVYFKSAFGAGFE